MKKALLIGCGVIAALTVAGIALIIVLAALLPDTPRSTTATAERQEPGVSTAKSAAPTRVVTAAPTPAPLEVRALLALYKSNGVAADQRFKGKRLRVAGIIGEIKKELLGRPYVTVGTGADFEIPVVQCVFAMGTGEETARLSRGQHITVEGDVDGLMGNVLMSDCALP